MTLRVEDRSPLTYPRWVSTVIEQDQVLLHHLDDASWGGCLDAVARLADDQLDIRRASWRMHLFAPVHGIPGGAARQRSRSCSSRTRCPTALAP